MPIRQQYEEELDKLNNDVIRMGSLIEDSIVNVIKALNTMDAQAAQKIIDGDDIIDNLEWDIEKNCIKLIAKQQPVATDLRKVTSIMRIIADIERIADHCSDISEYILQLAKEKEAAMPAYVPEMLKEMKQMVADTIDSFVRADVKTAEKVQKADDTVDNYFEQIMNELCIAMKHNPDRIKQYADYLMIIKYVERMADHASNIAGWIIFIVTGVV